MCLSKKNFLRYRSNPFRTKELRKTIMLRLKLKNIFNKKGPILTGTKTNISEIPV